MKATIGRDLSNDIVISDSTNVSGFHCTVTDSPGGYLLIEDLGSRNFTSINGQQITIARFFPNDELYIANVKIDYKWLKDELQKKSRYLKREYPDEIALLKKLYEDYVRSIRKLDWRKQLQVALVNAAILITGVFVNIHYFQKNEEMDKIIQAIVSVTLLAGFLGLQFAFDRTEDRKIALRREFLTVYICPNCGGRFDEEDIYVLLKRGCGHCKKTFE